MANQLDNVNRSVLEDRPTITFVEPKVIAVPPTPIEPELPRASEVIDEIRQTKALANAVDVLAAALQGRVDLKAKDMEIDLDPKVDAAVVQAMRRMYPDDEPTVITYQQYKTCKDRLLARGAALADQALQYTNPQAISEARQSAIGLAGVSNAPPIPGTTAAATAEAAGAAGVQGAGGVGGIGSGAVTSSGVSTGVAGGAGPGGGAISAAGVVTTGGLTTPIAAPNPFYDDYEGAKKAGMYGSKKSKRGGLRPELDGGSMVVEALDIDEFQDCMIKILVNFIWKNFIRPVVQIIIASLPIPGAALAAKYVPKKICKCPPGFKVKEMIAKGLTILGEDKPPKPSAPPQPDANKIAKGK